MKRERGSGTAVFIILILLLAAGGYYYFFYRSVPAEAELQDGQEEVEGQEQANGEEPKEQKAHERIKSNYSKKLQKRLKHMPE